MKNIYDVLRRKEAEIADIYDVLRQKEAEIKDIYDVLQQKKAEFELLKIEVQALRVVAPLLEDELQVEAQVVPPMVGTDPAMQAKPVVAAPNDVLGFWPYLANPAARAPRYPGA